MMAMLKGRRSVAALVVKCVLVAGCSVGQMGGNPFAPETFSVPPGCDPDGLGPCASDWFVCVEDDAGNKWCEGQESAVPDSGSWDCAVDGDSLVCEGDHIPADGGAGGGWDCVENGDGSVTCTTDSYVPASSESGGAWDCWYEGDSVVCESGDFDEDALGDLGGGDLGGGDGVPGGGSEGDGDENLDGDVPGDGDSPPPSGGPGDVPDGGQDICFYDESDPDGAPIVRGVYEFDTVGDRRAIHIWLIFDESFVDNSYGVNSSDGYRGGNKGHTFRDLVSSDHAEVGFVDGAGNEKLLAKFDYITADGGDPTGYDCLGVTGGDGRVLSGDGSAVLDATSSLDRNFHDLGCVFTEDSPTPAECPEWENRVIYEMWIAADLFGAAGFGYPMLTYVHASPSRTDDTIPVLPAPCP